MYQPPEPHLWPADLTRPSCDQIRQAVLTATRTNPDKFMTGRGTPSIARRMYGLLCQRIRGMSTPEIADVLGVAAHSSFANNGDSVCEYCQSVCGTATYNEIVRVLIVEMETRRTQPQRHK